MEGWEGSEDMRVGITPRHIKMFTLDNHYAYNDPQHLG
jgi:hypothetical protein